MSVTQEAFPAKSLHMEWRGAAKSEAIDSYRQCILLVKIVPCRRAWPWAAWGKAACPEHPLDSCWHRIGNALGYNEPFPESLSQWVYKAWFLISWGSATSISAGVQGTLHPPLPHWTCPVAAAHRQLGGFQVCDFWNVLLWVVSWGSRLITGHALTHSMWGFAGGKQCEINPRSSSIETDSRLRFHWEFTGSLKVFTLREFDIFQILSYRAETTERELFNTSKLFRLWSCRGQHSLPFLLCPWCTQTHLTIHQAASLPICIFVFPTPVL